jgi:rare lipoprotein A (peptidoglycan hydrolase)
MIGRARRAFPGMVMSMLLTCPAFAAHAAAPAHSNTVPPRRLAAPHRPIRAAAHIVTRSGRPHGKIRHFRVAAKPHTVAEAGPVWNDGTGRSSWHQTGIASWYGGTHWQGHRTSSGGSYDENKFTAAHATLPLGTKVRVTLEGSQRSVIVTINDRPGTHSRIIDLSRGAAAELGILSRGVAVVTLSIL